MFARQTVSEITKAAQYLAIEPAALLAVASVESGGVAFFEIDGKREPPIRFEAHYFDRRLSEKERTVARAKGLAAPVAGAIPNPATQAARWRMLDEAVAINADAAYESVSWGIGQVMGTHWSWLGYGSLAALVAEARSGVAGQTRLMARYIEKTGLAEALRSHDWATFARGYNGPAYKAGGYDRKLAAAYSRQSGSASNSDKPAPLRQRARGDAVSALQSALAALGYTLAVDGIFGRRTADAVRRFQADHALSVDGIVGPATMAALEAAGVRQKGVWASFKAWLTRLLGYT